MRPTSHALIRLERLYRFVLRKMRLADVGARFRTMAPPPAGPQWRSLDPLEPRILFSASPLGDEPGQDPDAAHHEAAVELTRSGDAGDPDQMAARALNDLVNGSSGTGSVDQHARRELIIVDAQTPDHEVLVGGLLSERGDGARLEVVVLDSDRDGIEQISRLLAGYTGLDAVHIVSHGTDGAVQLGSTWLSGDDLDEFATQISGWSDALTDDADLLFYGCNLAGSDEGQALVDALAGMTGADVAASTDLTGAERLGGDWDLEYHAGTIESSVAFSAQALTDWIGTLEGDAPAEAHAEYIASPLAFEANAGQTDESVDFFARGSGYSVFLTRGDAVIALDDGDGGYAFRLDLVGADDSPAVSGSDPLSSSSHYFVGNDASAWESGVAHSGSVTYDSVWEGIDVRYYGNQRQLEYDFIVGAGADAEQIVLDFQGADSVSIDADGNLVIGLTGHDRDVSFRAPYAYQDSDTGRVEVTSAYVINDDGTVAFELGDYDSSRELIIDPILDYSTYLGGTGTDQAYAITVDGAGDVYVLGKTISADFPATLGSFGGNSDAFVAKISPDGAGNSDLVFATYIGGSGNDYGQGGIELDGSGNIIILGSTESADFATTAGAYQTSLGGASDAYIIKLNAAGDTLLYSTYYGGGGGLESGNGLALDGSGDVYITGQTLSGNLPTQNAYDTGLTGDSDTFVAKLTLTGGGSSDLLYSTYLGGENDYEGGNAIAVDSSGLIYVAGKTLSTNHPTTAGAFDTALGGGSDGYLTVLDPSLSGASQLVYSTYIGGSGSEQVTAMYLDDATGYVYLGGTTTSADLPTTAGAFDTTYSAGNDAFVIKLDPSGNGASDLLYSTYLGGSGHDYIYDLEVDAGGTVYIAGAGADGMPLADPIQGTFAGGNTDAYVAKLDLAGGGASDLIFATYLGGTDLDQARGIAIDGDGNIYVAGMTESADMSTTSGAYSGSNTGGAGTYEAFVAKITSQAAPVVNLPGGALAYSGNDPATVIDATATITDADSADFDGGTLTVDFSLGGTGNDRVAIRDEGAGAGNITLSGSNVLFDFGAGPMIIGTFSGGTSGSDPLVVVLNANATAVAAQALVRNVTYENVSAIPLTSLRTLRIVLTDGDGGTSAPATVTINVGTPNTGTAIWRNGASTTPEWNGWDGADFGTAGNTAVAGDFREMAGARAPSRDEIIVIGVTEGSDISGMMWDGSTWTAFPFNNLADNVTDSFSRRFDVVYESVSGDAMIVWDNGSGGASPLSYRIWDGSSWSAEATIATPSGGDPKNLELVASPDSDEIILTAGNPSNGHYAMVWNGTAWGNGQVTGSGLDDDIYVAYEQQSGDALVVYGKGDTSVYHRTWNGTSWSAEGSVAIPGDASGNVRRLTLGSDPDSDRIALGVVTYDGDNWLSVWNGSAWEASQTATTSGTGQVHDAIAVAFETGTGRALAAYGESGSSVIRYRTWTDGDGWSAEMSGPDIGAEPNTIILDSDPTSSRIMLSAQDANSDVNFVLWDGTAWGTPSEQETDTTEIKNQPFLFLWDQVRGNSVAPTITPGQSLAIAESAANGASAGTVLATDPDRAGSLQNWTIVSGNGDGIFQIDANTGEITIADNTNLDYESATSYVLGVRVEDGAHTSTVENVTINVTDVNDVTPTVTPGQSFGVNESAANGTSVGTVLATDPDTVGSLGSWTIVSGNGDGIFQIDANTGEITIADNTNLDYESATSYVLGVRAGDGTNTSATENVTINVTDVNDVTPTVTPGQSFGVTESAANGASVGTVLATDPDTVGSLGSWTIVSGNADGIFQIDANTGEITIADNTSLDYESATSYILGVRAGDGTNTSATENVTINVTDVNDVTPTVTPGQSFGVTESAANGASVGTVLATDPDTVGSIGSWTIVSGNGDGIFQIDANTGEITIADKTNLDYESATSYVLGVRAGDGTNTSATENVTINVTDVNDVTPTVTPGQSFGVVESAANGTSVGTVLATDPDTVGSIGSWTIVSGNGDGIFQIDANTGEITIADNTNLDYESATSYVLGVRAGDGTNTSATENVTINVTDVNDVTPTVTPGQSFGVNESAANGTSVGTVLATDPDTVGSIGSWTIVSGNGDGIFQIDANTGEITIADNTNLDYESATSYVLGVRAGDGTNTSATENVTINVTDVNDVTPTVTPGQSFGVNESAVNGTSVGTVLATDPDTVGSIGSWTIVSGNVDGIFQIDANTGEITIADNTNLDYESATSYVLGVRAGDGTNTSATENVTINVTDVNDVTPTVTPGQSFGVNESAVNGTSVGTVLATDPDTVGSIGSWTIVSGNGDGIFQIDANTGEITIADNTNLDYESATSYVLGVRAGDGTNTSATENVTINVTDVNDVTPTVTPGQSFGVTESAANGTSVGTVLATDPDTVGSIGSWTIVSGNGDGIFQIDANTGEITIADNTSLDYESATSYVLGVRAGDGTNTSATENVTINVSDVNDVTPTVTPGQSFGVTESAANGTSVGTVLATDPDTVGSIGSWTIVSGNGDGIFQIDANTGEITIADNTSLDYESATSYVLGVRAGDGTNTSATESVTINVTDVNDVTPTVTPGQSFGVSESAANGASVGTVLATDPDTVGTIGSWTIVSGNGDGIFQIDVNTGEITIADNTNLDYESATSYVLGVRAGDGTNTSATENVTINVTDVNDVTPTVTPGQSFGVSESAANATSIGTVLATDPDTVGSLGSWTIVSGNADGIFQIDANTGEITIADNTNLDYESATSYVLGVRVEDGAHTSTVENVTINVTDVNDVTPTVTPGQSFGVTESAANGASVGTVLATDPDTVGSLGSWTIVSGNGDGIFQIDANTGEITIADKTNLDYESATSYVLGVRAGDGTNTSATENVTINVTDVNDVTPTVTPGQSFGVAESAANGASVGTVLATDPDTVGSLGSWTIVSGNGDGIFQIDANTGEITIADNTSLDYESATSYVLGVQAGDGTNTSATENVTINVTDVNDVTPTVTPGQSFGVTESAANGTSVGTVLATDPDTVGSLGSWTIVSGNGDGIFQIDANTGEITIADNANLDYESATSYVLGVRAGDGTNTSATENVTINVTDVNDVTPTVTPGQSFGVTESAANGTSVGTVLATDPDTVGSLGSWTIVSGNGDGIFQIDANTGEITIADNTNLDYESAASYVLGVRAGDGTNTSATENVTINVTDINDVTPTVTPGQSFGVSESAANGTSVGTVLATDPDTVGSLGSWTIVSGNGDGIFQIDANTGEITIADNTNLDYESTTSYVLGVRAGDGTNTSATENVTINVTDVNDVTPTVTPGQSFGATESAANGASVGTVLATDPDTVGSLGSWAIVSGNGDGIFQIDANTGEITIADNTSLDYESATSYVLGVRAGDGTNTSATENVTINVTDVNDVTPTVTPGQSFGVNESAVNGTSVGTVLATDPDTVGSIGSWTIVSGNGDGIFQIDANTGEITIADNTNLDYESATSYVLGVRAGDGTNTSATENVTINVTDVNDVTPTVTPGQSFGVTESAANGTSVGTVLATDPDTVGSIGSWTIVSGNGDGIFQIDANTGEITIADNTSLDYESATSYVLGVRAGDGTNTSATENVTINVSDVNDVTPTVTPGQSFGVTESAANGTSVGTVLATDPDTVGSIGSWTIVSGNGDGIFQIDANTGEITIADNTSLDYESATSYVLGVRAGDGTNTSATENVTINVTDVNDVTPTVTPGQSFGVSESAANGTSVGTVLATDPDTVGSLGSWTIVSGNGDGIFQIDANTGEITIADNTNLDYESATSYVLGVRAGDGTNTSATENVTINVTDVNDVTPTVTPGQSFGVTESAANGASVGTVLATDPDTVGSLGSWAIVSGNGDGIFQIDANTGEITIADDTNLDYESATSYVLGVRAGDGTNTSAPENVTINVTDVNDVTPTVTPGQSFGIGENAANGATVGTVLATDPDTVGSLGSWTIVSGNADGIFQIDANTGEITIADNSNLDYESATSFVLGVRAGDGTNTSATENVTINVTDVNDVTPTVTPGQSFGIGENAANGATVGTVLATDPDTVGSLGSWTIASGNADGIFQIDANTGEITIADDTNLDYESATSYVLGVRAGDGTNTSATENVTINVTDVNDVTPTVTPGQSFGVTENAANGTSVGTVLATDPDTVGSLQGWTIVSGNDDGIFQIDANTGEITIADNSNLDYESVTSYVLGVRAGDGTNTSATENVTINVANIGEAPTTTGIADVTVDEDASTISIDLHGAFDDAEDSDASLDYAVVGNTNAGLFESTAIEGVSGTLKLDLASDVSGSTTMSVRATDSDGQSVTATFFLMARAVNDAPVVAAQGDIAVDEGEGATITANDLRVTDVDDTAEAITFTLKGLPTTGALSVGGKVLLDGDSFTQADVDAGRLTYHHGGGEAARDCLRLAVTDGSGAQVNVTIGVSVAARPALRIAAPPEVVPGPERTPEIETAAPERDNAAETSADEKTEDADEADNEPESSAPELDETVDDQTVFVTDDAAAQVTLPTGDSGPAAAASWAPNDASADLGERSSRAVKPAWTAAPLAFAAAPLETLQALQQQVHEAFRSDLILGQMSSMGRELTDGISSQTSTVKVAYGTAAGTTSALAIGYAVWALRGGSLLASALTLLPALPVLDPLPVLEESSRRSRHEPRPDKKEDATERRIGQMLD